MTHHTHCDCDDHGPLADAATLLYAGYGVQFRYPKNWTVSEETGPDQTTITVQSPGTSYWTLTLFEDRPDPDQIVESVMQAYQSLYEELDVYELEAQVLGFPAVTRELDFVCLDLVNSAAMIAFQSVNQSVLVIYQGEDRELEETRPVMEAITRTLVCDLGVANGGA